MVSDAPHPEAARAWLDFIRSDAAFKVFEHCGFQRYEAKPQPCNATW
jgi:ABC-type Fe3+ transport system substrate-binding protein